MPNNRNTREKEVTDRFDFYVPGHEYSAFNATLIILDAIVEGGNTAVNYLENEMAQFGIDLANAMANATPPVNPLTEPLYSGYFVFENWETVLGNKVPSLNKAVPYVAARLKPGGMPPKRFLGWFAAPGLGTDIGVGPNNAAWLIGIPADAGPGGYPIFAWDDVVGQWNREPGGAAALRIAVSPEGTPWAVNSANKIVRRGTDGVWKELPGVPGLGTDIGVGPNNAAWLIGIPADAGPGGYPIFAWDDVVGQWNRDQGGAAINIAVSPDGGGKPWVTNKDNRICEGVTG